MRGVSREAESTQRCLSVPTGFNASVVTKSASRSQNGSPLKLMAPVGITAEEVGRYPFTTPLYTTQGPNSNLG